MPVIYGEKQMETQNGWAPRPREHGMGVVTLSLAKLVPRSQLPPCAGAPLPLLPLPSCFRCIPPPACCSPACGHTGREGLWGGRGQRGSGGTAVTGRRPHTRHSCTATRAAESSWVASP